MTAYRAGEVCCLVSIGVIALVAIAGLTVGSIALSSSNKDNSREQYRHVFCIDAYDRLGVDVYTQLHAKLAINTRSNTACLKGMWTRDADNCTSLDSIDIRGPINDDELLDPAYVIGTFENVSSTNVSGQVNVCFHLSPSRARRLLENPSLVYVEMALTGDQCSDGVYRDYVTSLCADASFKVAEVDNDDDDTDDVDYDAPYTGPASSEDDEDSDTSEARRVTVHKTVAHKGAVAHHGGPKVGAATNARHHH